MFPSRNYEVLDFMFPTKGMNQSVSPEVLPNEYGWIIDNLLTKPLGEGTVRFGTREAQSFDTTNTEVLKIFPYTTPAGDEHLIVYTRQFQPEVISVENPPEVAPETPNVINFLSTNRKFYVEEAPVKIVYEFNGIHTLYDYVGSFVDSGDDTQPSSLTLKNKQLPFDPDGAVETVITGISFCYGAVYAIDLATMAALDEITGLSACCVPRGVSFNHRFILCNGVDSVVVWDGTSWGRYVDYVKESGTNITPVVGGHQVTFTRGAVFDINHYLNGNTFRLRGANGETVYTLNGNGTINVATGVVTLTTTEEIVDPGANCQLIFTVPIPSFSYIALANDRLWALGPGVSSRSFRQNAMTVYYQDKTNAKGWFRETTQQIPSIDLSSKHGEPDNLEAIVQSGSYTLFIGRSKTQVFTGTTPDGANANFQWSKTLSTGVLHGNLVLSLPNDVFFVSPSGIQSFGTLNIGQQFMASSMNVIDSLVQDYVKDIMASDDNYWHCDSFLYQIGPFGGFKIGKNPTLVSLIQTTMMDTWVRFTGDFEKASCFCCFGDKLFLGVGNAIYQYADGKDGSKVSYGDKDGLQPIFFSWTLPKVSTEQRIYANQRYEIQADLPSTFVSDPANGMYLEVVSDVPKFKRVEKKCTFEMQGDLLNTIPMTTEEPYFVNSSTLGFRLENRFSWLKYRFKFLSSRFSACLRGQTTTGPVTLKRLKFYGTIERG